MLKYSRRLFFLIILAFIACETTKETQEDTSAEENEEITAINLVPLNSSPDLPYALLNMNFPLGEENIKAGKVKFSYNITNYRLGEQTANNTMNLASAEEGQHLKLILNNHSYSVHDEPEFEKELKEGHYVALSFLSRSYHESLKNPDAYILRQFTVGNVQNQALDLSLPHLFYSMPEGIFSGEDAKNVLLDFYLVNTGLSADGHKVSATINNQSFIIEEWMPHVIQGMPTGKNTIKLELLDKEGNLVAGPYNQVERVITLSK